MVSAAEVIELIKKLPPAERAEVVAFVRKESVGVSEPLGDYAGKQAAVDRSLRTIPSADAERLADQIFERHPDLFLKLSQ